MTLKSTPSKLNGFWQMVLSTLMGLVLPALMPWKYTHLIGGALFQYFGFKLLNDSRAMRWRRSSRK